jgi:penicillin-insensitive murein endopeptidase
MLRLPLLALCLAAALPGCVHRGFFTDGTSVSLGRSTRGALLHGRELPPAGVGYQVPLPWRARGASFGTDELVAAIERAAARVAERFPGGTLGVGDLSSRRGGAAVHHRSHENGRDADLLFYAVDDEGLPLPPPGAMPRYDRQLRSRPPREAGLEPVSPRRFDVPRNWALVAALLDDPGIAVEYLFVSGPLRQALLGYAVESGEPEALTARARELLRGPGGRVPPHDDHLHLRILCPPDDRALGCVDRGKVRLQVETVPRRSS